MWLVQAALLAASALSSLLFAMFVLPGPPQLDDRNPIMWDSGGDGISWSDCRNWTADSCPGTDSTVTLGSGSEIELSSNVILNGSKLTIDSGAMLNILSGAALRDASAGSVLSNSGVIIVSAGGSMSWEGLLNNTADGSINNKGVFESCGQTVNGGTINNKLDAKFIVCGNTLDNIGKIYNFGTFTGLTESILENHGTFLNAAKYENQADFRNGGLFRSNGTITNDAGSKFVSDTCAIFVNSGSLIGQSVQFVPGSC